MTETDKAYTAGIMDGEGCIRLQKNYGLDVSVGNTDLDLLMWLKEHWGGKIHPNRWHSPTRNAKPFYHWRICGGDAFPMLRAILPYMVVKHNRAQKALELEAVYGLKNNYLPGFNESCRVKRQEVRDALQKMNRRGVNFAVHKVAEA